MVIEKGSRMISMSNNRETRRRRDCEDMEGGRGVGANGLTVTFFPENVNS